jgi:hypothetical protein
MSLAVLILHNYTLSSHKTPWEALEVCNVAHGHGGRRLWPGDRSAFQAGEVEG